MRRKAGRGGRMPLSVSLDAVLPRFQCAQIAPAAVANAVDDAHAPPRSDDCVKHASEFFTAECGARFLQRPDHGRILLRANAGQLITDLIELRWRGVVLCG